jgi:hypothetical protein
MDDFDLVVLACCESSRRPQTGPVPVRLRVTFATRAAAPGLDRIMSPKHQPVPHYGSASGTPVLLPRSSPAAAHAAAPSGERELPLGPRQVGGLFKIATLEA